jgi:hypothetical protein
MRENDVTNPFSSLTTERHRVPPRCALEALLIETGVIGSDSVDVVLGRCGAGSGQQRFANSPSTRQRPVWVAQLTTVDQSGRTAALTVAERQCSPETDRQPLLETGRHPNQYESLGIAWNHRTDPPSTVAD